MDLALAAHVAERIRRCADSLSTSVTWVKPHLTDDKFNAYTHQVGSAVGEMGFALLFPIYEHYPQLNPDLKQIARIVSTDVLRADGISENSDNLAERVRSMCEKVRAELLSVTETIQQQADPQLAKEFAARLQTVVELVANVQVQ